MFRRTLIFAAVLGCMAMLSASSFAHGGYGYGRHCGGYGGGYGYGGYRGYGRPVVVAPRPVVVGRPVVVPQPYPAYGYPAYPNYGYGGYGASFGVSTPGFGLYIR